MAYVHKMQKEKVKQQHMDTKWGHVSEKVNLSKLRSAGF